MCSALWCSAGTQPCSDLTDTPCLQVDRCLPKIHIVVSVYSLYSLYRLNLLYAYSAICHIHGAAGGLPIPRVLRYSRQILEALAELHAKKIIMGDLKPQNLLLHNLLDELVVTDFGLSRIVEHTLGAYRTSTVQGTPNYM